MNSESDCPKCGHRWTAHHGRAGGERCSYRPWADFHCPCREKNPTVAAEDELARALWNGLST